MKLSKNTKGFSTVELVMVVVVVALIGAAGWLVYKNHHKTPLAVTKTVTTPSAKPSTPVNPYAGWKSYSSTTGHFILLYPSSWTLNDCSGDALIGATASDAGICNSDAIAQIQVSSMVGDERQNWQLKSDTTYPDLKTENVTINGNVAVKQTATLTTDPSAAGIGPPNGTKVTDYIFYVNGRSYLFAYNQTPTAADISKDANLIVTQTLKFN